HDNTICRIGLVWVANKRHPTFGTGTLLADVELVVDDNASVLVFLSRNNAWNQVRECLRQNLIVMMLVDRHDVLSRTPAHLMNERGTARQGQPSTPRAPLGCLQEWLKLFGPHERKLVSQHIAFRC